MKSPDPRKTRLPLLALLGLFAALALVSGAANGGSPMELTSPAFAQGGIIPSQYTCDGPNIPPPLAVSGVPRGAKSLVLIMEDPDVPRNLRPDGMFDHWVVYNIPPAWTGTRAGEEPPGQHGLGTRNDLKYRGPCPPDREHRYFFRLYALDATLSFNAPPTKAQTLSAMKNHILTRSELMGRYERK